MLPANAPLALALLITLLLATSLCGLAASGHFPYERRPPALVSSSGTVVLFGALAVAAISLAVGAVFAWRVVPWYAAVIGGGVAILGAPMALRPLPDRFVDGACASPYRKTWRRQRLVYGSAAAGSGTTSPSTLGDLPERSA
jgi:hypothetical protein